MVTGVDAPPVAQPTEDDLDRVAMLVLSYGPATGPPPAVAGSCPFVPRGFAEPVGIVPTVGGGPLAGRDEEPGRAAGTVCYSMKLVLDHG
jgi:hypothetical protein